MGRIQHSWELFKQSWAVLRQNPSLNIFPVVSSIVSLLVTASFWAPVALYLTQNKEANNLQALHYVLIFCSYVLSYFVVTFFNAALIHCARVALSGGKPTVRDGLHAATGRIGAIFAWSLISATVGTILQFLNENAGLPGKIVAGLLGTGWNILTFFTVPVLVLEGRGPIDSVKGSWESIKRTWGQSLIGNAGLGIATGLLMLVPIPIVIASFFTQSTPVIVAAIALCIIYWVVLATVSATLSGIFKTAVYLFATTGQAPVAYSAHYVQQAFLPKPEGKVKNFYNRG